MNFDLFIERFVILTLFGHKYGHLSQCVMVWKKWHTSTSKSWRQMAHYAFYVFTELSTPFATNEPSNWSFEPRLRHPALGAQNAVNELRGCVTIKRQRSKWLDKLEQNATWYGAQMGALKWISHSVGFLAILFQYLKSVYICPFLTVFDHFRHISRIWHNGIKCKQLDFVV